MGRLPNMTDEETVGMCLLKFAQEYQGNPVLRDNKLLLGIVIKKRAEEVIKLFASGGQRNG